MKKKLILYPGLDPDHSQNLIDSCLAIHSIYPPNFTKIEQQVSEQFCPQTNKQTKQQKWNNTSFFGGGNQTNAACRLQVTEWISFPERIAVSMLDKLTSTRQEGWLSPTERASISAISPKTHFGLPWYAPGTIAVNVIWMERGFNAGQTHCSICPSIFNRLRAIARYW